MAAALSAVRAVLGQMAQAMVVAPTRGVVGRYQLRDAQRDTCAALRQAMHAHGGALLADAPGSGKTVIALAVAANYPDVLVLTPAAIREQWRRAAARAGVAVRIESHESLSRGHLPRTAPLIIVDEAHHLRNPATQRYRTLATLATGRHLLLLTATPVVNRVADRDALLTLIVGSNRAGNTSLQQAIIVRRTRHLALAQPTRQLPPLAHAGDVPGLGAAIAALPPPFPAADGRAASALVRMSLAMAWASSLSALDTALRRRQQRGHALAERLAAGHWPTRHTLGLWLHGDDATQLALPLVAADQGEAPAEALAVLRAHLAAVDAIRERIAVHVSRDTAARAAALRALVEAESPRRVLVLAHHAETVRALQRALRQRPGVLAIVGDRVIAAAGRWTRDEVVAALGPRCAPWTPQDPRGIRLVLATDILSEGVELQGCATVVHGDLAWTPARLEQRVGRVARSGQRDEVRVTAFAVPSAAERLVRIQQRLLQKRRARTSALAASDAATRLAQILADARRDAPPTGDTHIVVARGSRCGFLALLTRDAAQSTLVTGHYANGRWRVSTSARRLLHTVESIMCEAGAVPAARGAATAGTDRQALACVRRVLRRWLHARQSRHLVHGQASLPEPMLRRARRILDAWVVAQPLARRAAATTRVAHVLRCLSGMHGSGAEQALRQALSSDDREAVMAALDALAAARVGGEAEPPTAAPLRLSALVILRPASADLAPPAPSTESAAPR